MKEMFLCSDRLEKFQSMGENGQAVYISALQLRETLRLRRHAAIADTLAIPQVSEQGDRIDWYAPFSGDVIPWAAATESEKQTALSQLELNQSALRKFSEDLSQNPHPEQRLFGQLLDKALQFPDNQHVWLVDGKPVISFWGFVNARHQMRLDPLDCLRPAVPGSAPVAPVAAAQAVPVGTVAAPLRRGWWWRFPGWLRWLLPLLLLLLIALLFLRSCVPGVAIPGFNGLSGHLPLFSTSEPAVAAHSVSTGEPGVATTPLPGLTTETGREAEAASAAGVESTQLVPESEQILGSDPAAEPPQPAGSPAQAEASVPEAQPETSEPTISTGAKAPLSIPAGALAQGNTDFLNGRWHAGSGIQDRRTGKPLSLNYQIKDGQGAVQMTRGDGVDCRGEVKAAIQSGQLVINNQGEAQCSDGSVYQMPEILCTPGAQSVADCKGRYDAKTLFPLSMKQEASHAG
ncbi:SrfA family protein [Cedecea davisae]